MSSSYRQHQLSPACRSLSQPLAAAGVLPDTTLFNIESFPVLDVRRRTLLARRHAGSAGTSIQYVGSSSFAASITATHRARSTPHHCPTCQPPCSGQNRSRLRSCSRPVVAMGCGSDSSWARSKSLLPRMRSRVLIVSPHRGRPARCSGTRRLGPAARR